MRDIDADTKAALVEEYESYMRAGRTADAEQVAQALKDQHEHEVGQKAREEPAHAPEKAEAGKLPEAAIGAKPRRGRPPRQDKTTQDDSKAS